MLKQLISALNGQHTGGLFTYSIVIADNDEDQSGAAAVAESRMISSVPLKYCVEPRRSIALARNKVIENACGDYLALIDDDESPAPDWLLTLYKTCEKYQVEGVLGAVLCHFDETPPAWVEKGGFYKKKIYPTGMRVDWPKARTSNVLLKRHVVAGDNTPFRPEFRAGEDQDFFRRKIEEGRAFVWCADAVVFETIPPARWTRSYLLQKALLRGATARLQPTCTPASIVKSTIAVPLYAVALPGALLCGQSCFMRLLVRLCDHLGKLSMVLGIDPVRGPYVSG
jgi:glycosyltransferase involved in cell wall biosynthesis